MWVEWGEYSSWTGLNIQITLPKHSMIIATDADPKLLRNSPCRKATLISIRGGKTPTCPVIYTSKQIRVPPRSWRPLTCTPIEDYCRRYLDARPYIGQAATSEVTIKLAVIQTDKLAVINHLEDNAFFLTLWGLVCFSIISSCRLVQCGICTSLLAGAFSFSLASRIHGATKDD